MKRTVGWGRMESQSGHLCVCVHVCLSHFPPQSITIIDVIALFSLGRPITATVSFSTATLIGQDIAGDRWLLKGFRSEASRKGVNVL